MTKTREEQQAYFDAQTKLYEAQRKQAESKVGSPEEAEGRQEAQAALDVIADIEYREGHREEFEEKVTLIAPNPHASGADGALGVTWDRGRAEVPRSLAERLVAEFPAYQTEESA